MKLGLFERLDAYMKKIGGVEAIVNMPNHQKAFEDFILEGKKDGDQYQALLGCALQAYVNSYGDAGFTEGVGGNQKKKGMEEHPDFLKALKGEPPEEGKITSNDNRSYHLFIKNLLLASGRSDGYDTEDLQKLSNALGGLVLKSLPGLLAKKRQACSPKILHWGNLIKQYDASPWKDMNVAVIGNAVSLEEEYLSQANPTQAAKLSSEQTLPSFLFKQATEFNDQRGYLTEGNIEQYRHQFDAVLDCNVIYADNKTVELIGLMAMLAKPGGMIVHDQDYGGGDHMLLPDAISELRKKIGQSNIIISDDLGCVVVRQDTEVADMAAVTEAWKGVRTPMKELLTPEPPSNPWRGRR